MKDLVVPENKLQILKVVGMDSKPPMAKALENLKLRDYPEEARNGNTVILTSWLLNLLGVKGNPDTDKQHLVATKFINDTLLNYTYQEIKLAFEMYVSGKFYENNGKPMLVTQQFNSVVIGRVMREYQALKDRELDEYRRLRTIQLNKKYEMPELTKEEKELLVYEGVLNCFENYKQTREVINGYVWVYDHLDELNIINFSPKEKKAKMLIAQERLKAEAVCYTNAIKRKRLLETIQNLSSSPVVTEAKRLLLQDFFANVTVKKKHIREYL